MEAAQRDYVVDSEEEDSLELKLPEQDEAGVGKARKGALDVTTYSYDHIVSSFNGVGTGFSPKNSDTSLGNDSPDIFSLGIAERAKLRSRTGDKAALVHVPEIIDISSDDEIDAEFTKTVTMPASPKPRSVKRFQVAQTYLADTSMDSETNTVPVPSSSFPARTNSLPLPEIQNSPPLDSSILRSSSPLSPCRDTSVRPGPSDVAPSLAHQDMDMDPGAKTMHPPPVPLSFLDEPPSMSPITRGGSPSPKDKKDRKSKQAVDSGPSREATPRKPARRSRKRTTVEVVIKTPPKRRTVGGSDDATAEDELLIAIGDGSASHIPVVVPREDPVPPSTSHVPASDEEDELLLLPELKPKPRAKLRKKVADDTSTDEPPKKKKRTVKKAYIELDDEEAAPTAARLPAKRTRKKSAGPPDNEEPAISRAPKPTSTVASKSADRGSPLSSEGKGTPDMLLPRVTVCLLLITGAWFTSSVRQDHPSILLSPPAIPSSSFVEHPARRILAVARQPSTPAPSHRDTKYAIARNKSTPMSELIRRVSSQPSSPFVASTSSSSPLARTSKSTLRHIAPLLHTRHTPPPPRPPPPPPKKTKKQLELEEKWKEELEDEVEGWFDLTDREKDRHVKRKRDQYYSVDD
ncbi:hypothetical protein K488DRAFT_88821 [Vararia minispora EC-137]|uniref:Uncharacterized protein n=1 Tax=Vararia minispora EC-137 TaxID=1314806 RepID=A0ACB8QCG3_9AGAM|nr:hypothetical protein K488DRAFT_88821 [Vararia minispora EC-137]